MRNLQNLLRVIYCRNFETNHERLLAPKISYNFFWNGFCSLPSAWKNYRFVKCNVDIIGCTSV